MQDHWPQRTQPPAAEKRNRYHERVRDRNARARSAQEKLMETVIRLCYPDGVILPREGGLFFRELSECWQIPEAALSEMAHRLGYWDCKPENMLRKGAAPEDP